MSNPTPLNLPDNITVSRAPGESAWKVEVDGQPFPYYLGQDVGAEVKVSTERHPAVTITLIAASITVDDRALLPGGPIEDADRG